MADDFAALGKKLSQLSADLSGERQRALTQRVANLARKDALEVAARDAGADRRLSNWKRAGTLGVKVEMTGATAATITPTPSGPWKVLTEGAAAHTETAKLSKITGRGSKVRRSARKTGIASGTAGAFAGERPLKTPYGPRYKVKIPHTRGKQTWDKAATKIAAESPGRVNTEVVNILKSVF